METVDMKEFIPTHVQSGKKGEPCKVNIEDAGDSYCVWYEHPSSNQTGIVGKRRHQETLPKSILLDDETFEVMGLLQGEMSKTYRQMLTFANSEPTIMNKVLAWFEREKLAEKQSWRWYVKINVPENYLDENTRETVTSTWIQNCDLDAKQAYAKRVIGTNVSKHTKPVNSGTLMVERSNLIFVQTIQHMVKEMTISMPARPEEQIIPYLRGIIAAEGCVDFDPVHGHRRVYITAVNDHERMIIEACLNRLGIETYDCSKIKDIVISRRDNIIKIQDMRLSEGSPEKNEKFSRMTKTYTGVWHESRMKKGYERF